MMSAPNHDYVYAVERASTWSDVQTCAETLDRQGYEVIGCAGSNNSGMEEWIVLGRKDVTSAVDALGQLAAHTELDASQQTKRDAKMVATTLAIGLLLLNSVLLLLVLGSLILKG